MVYSLVMMLNSDNNSKTLADNKSSKLSTWQLIREDMSANKGDWRHPGFRALAVHRFGCWAFGLDSRPLRFMFKKLYWMLFHFVRNVYGIEIKRTATIGRNVRIAHHQGVTIGGGAEIGDRCIIRQNVNIGAASTRQSYRGRARIGNDVDLGSGAQILGPISIGDGARIGANVVVTTDIPPHAIVFQAKPKVIQLPPEVRHD